VAEVNIQALLDGLAAELGAPVALDDVDFRLLAHTAHSDGIDEVRRSWIMDRLLPEDVRQWLERQHVREAVGPVRTPAEPLLGVAFPRWCVPVRFRGMHFGFVWVLESNPIPEDRLGPALVAAEQIGVISFRQRLLAQADRDLLRLLLIPSTGSESVSSAEALSIHPHKGPIAVAVVGATGGGGLDARALSDLEIAMQRAAEQASSESVLAGVISGLGVLLAPLRSREDMLPARRLAESALRLAAYFSDGGQFFAAIGGATSLQRASRSYAESLRALRIVRAMPKQFGPIAAWDDLGVFRPLTLLPPSEMESVLDPRIRALLSNENLAATAEVFLELAGNVQETAGRLHLHRTALYHRLDRIAALYELDLRRNGDDRLLTHLGLKLARLRSSKAAV